MKTYFLKTFMLITVLCQSLVVCSEDTNKIVATLDGVSLDVGRLSGAPTHYRQSALSLESASENDRDIAVIMDWVLERQKEKAINSYGITVTDDEVKCKVDEILKDRDAYVNKTKIVLDRLPKALREARLYPDQTDRIYEENLKGYMTYGLWKSHVAANYTDDEIAKFERHRPFSKKDIETVETPIKKMIVERKLREKLSETDKSISCEKVWQSWCSQQIKSAKVVIYDEELRRKYENALETMVK
jgi:hypothetical protein